MEQKKREKLEVLPQSCQINLSDFALFLSVMKVKESCEGLEISVEEYKRAKQQII